MGDTSISWTDKTWNITRGCRRISDGCGGANGAGGCYAERQAYRFSGPGQAYEGLVKLTANGPRWTGVGRFVPEMLAAPLRWKKPVRVFVDSMSDLFFDEFTNEQIAAVFGVMAACPRHTFQILTKRPRRMRAWFEWAGRITLDDFRELARGHMKWGRDAILVRRGTTWPLPNVWLGVSVEHQAAADERIPELLRTPAAVRFLSCEPLLDHLAIAKWMRKHSQAPDLWSPPLDWIIVGCESGPRARPCSVEWLRSLRDQSAAAGVAYFLKQATPAMGSLASDKPRPRPIDIGPGSTWKGGVVIELPYLDGVQHKAMPEVRHG